MKIVASRASIFMHHEQLLLVFVRYLHSGMDLCILAAVKQWHT